MSSGYYLFEFIRYGGCRDSVPVVRRLQDVLPHWYVAVLSYAETLDAAALVSANLQELGYICSVSGG